MTEKIERRKGVQRDNSRVEKGDLEKREMIELSQEKRRLNDRKEIEEKKR